MTSQENNRPNSSSLSLAIATTEARDVQEYRLPKPDPKQLRPDEIIAQVAYCGLNHIDVNQVKSGAYITEYPYILGREWSGQILHIGSDVKDLKPGDWVLGVSYQVGALQEQIVISRKYLCPKPDKISAEQASTIAHRYAAVMVALHMKEGLNLPLHPTEAEKAQRKIIIWGAATGSGMYAILALKIAGYRTILAVASTKQKDNLKSLGATDVFDRNESQVAKHILSKYPDISIGLVCQADEHGWDCVLEVVRPTEMKKESALLAYIIRLAPSKVPEGVTLRRAVVFSLLHDKELGDHIIQSTLPKLLALPDFMLPKQIKVFKDGSLAERVKAAICLMEKNSDVSATIQVSV
ncbi:Dehydrogenase azaJ [Psilocybe cubensis]|uniref:Enoyl reductase (ER) domain-containing protein n=2 Tax=Psilocybe cubensis TaxID=181762 RepID=A0A8H7XT52_PSICU|nr:Dehydrogenase azaJ [Psilocybe cubensis]KAH9480712.1 Dehydrogenase azaJ [Psilocybe cubensis]